MLYGGLGDCATGPGRSGAVLEGWLAAGLCTIQPGRWQPGVILASCARVYETLEDQIVWDPAPCYKALMMFWAALSLSSASNTDEIGHGACFLAAKVLHVVLALDNHGVSQHLAPASHAIMAWSWYTQCKQPQHS